VLDTIQGMEETLAKELDPMGEIKTRAFQNFLLYLLISPHDNEKVDLMHRVQKFYARNLEENPVLAQYLYNLLVFELLPLNMQEINQAMVSYQPFQESTEFSAEHLEEFKKQLVQHNLQVIEKYYSKIKLSTLARLIGVDEQRAEAELCDMVVHKRIKARINRLRWEVSFKKRQENTDGVLDSWNEDIKELLDKVEQTVHLINREKIV
jgi:26S proteasome regulatory subunit N5